MYVINITDDYDNMSSINCTENGNNIDKFKPIFSFTIACGLSFLCLMFLMVDTLIKPILRKESDCDNL